MCFQKIWFLWVIIQDVIIEEKICKHFTFMFSPLSNMKASDKTSKSSLRDVFEADVVCFEKTISTHFSCN